MNGSYSGDNLLEAASLLIRLLEMHDSIPDEYTELTSEGITCE